MNIISHTTLLFPIVLFLSACDGGDSDGPSVGEPLGPAEYTLTFNAIWGAGSHPNVPAGAHFSGLIGGAHQPGVRLWQAGSAASAGIQNMAERGQKGALQSEVNALIGAGRACSVISGGGISSSPGAVALSFTVTPECPVVSVVSMVAPSPDWFVGVSGVNLTKGNAWADVVMVQLDAYDAGTDSGSTHTSDNQPTIPRQAISRIGNLKGLGTFTFTRTR